MSVSVLPLGAGSRAFQASFSIQGEDFSFSLHGVDPSSKSSSLSKAKIECRPEMRAFLRGFEEILWNRLQSSKTVDAFCLEIRNLMECVLRARSKPELPVQLYNEIRPQIEEIGWDRIVHMSDDFTRLRLRVNDSANREHILQINLPSDFPLSCPSTTVELPTSWSAQCVSLKDGLSQFELALDSHQEFWNVTDDIDKRAWVLEPEHPSRADTSRRLSLGGHCSVLVRIDPESPRSLPECTFFGPETVVAPLRRKLKENSKKWMSDKQFVDNLETVLEMSIPAPEQRRQGGLCTECGICYAYKLPDAEDVPDRVCDNASCGQPFHTVCLVDWLRSLPTTRRSFSVLFGQCPYCSHPLAVKSMH